ncbi:uncharacterized protein PHALS_10104 [Plasmopara halstedii]|uniref:Uncharacterized protein n=1 Tax=Plasmopara halstedii TaxID=4781 RepID=A0A0N7L4X3_PLAHL|nr:uncharacterized protein PHALS_10104 [Plasmopara halstedii]CEG39875.1 hypothetical protein PHALS_10104 [Plasmopara halstedii]|eukprot:XP_024576244.1 hypothetical protein PHALS_10104 [Plasmopara halstedii]
MVPSQWLQLCRTVFGAGKLQIDVERSRPTSEVGYTWFSMAFWILAIYRFCSALTGGNAFSFYSIQSKVHEVQKVTILSMGTFTLSFRGTIAAGAGGATTGTMFKTTLESLDSIGTLSCLLSEHFGRRAESTPQTVASVVETQTGITNFFTEVIIFFCTASVGTVRFTFNAKHADVGFISAMGDVETNLLSLLMLKLKILGCQVERRRWYIRMPQVYDVYTLSMSGTFQIGYQGCSTRYLIAESSADQARFALEVLEMYQSCILLMLLCESLDDAATNATIFLRRRPSKELISGQPESMSSEQHKRSYLVLDCNVYVVATKVRAGVMPLNCVGSHIVPSIGAFVGPKLGSEVEPPVGPEAGPKLVSEVEPDVGPDNPIAAPLRSALKSTTTTTKDKKVKIVSFNELANDVKLYTPDEIEA